MAKNEVVDSYSPVHMSFQEHRRGEQDGWRCSTTTMRIVKKTTVGGGKNSGLLTAQGSLNPYTDGVTPITMATSNENADSSLHSIRDF